METISILGCGWLGLPLNLFPRTALHPKLYVFNKPEGTVSSLIGSANLTNRGLTINSEIAWCEREQDQAEAVNVAWDAVTQPAVLLTPEIIESYRAIRERVVRERPVLELEPVPEPMVGRIGQYRAFGEADV